MGDGGHVAVGSGSDADGALPGAGLEGTDEHTAPQLSRSALVVIDVQRDFLDGGAATVEGTTEALGAIESLTAAFRRAGRPVVHVVRLYEGEDVDLPRRTAIAGGAKIVRPGSPGSQLAPQLVPPDAPELDPETLLAGRLQRLGPDEYAMFKPRWDAFLRTPLDDFLRANGVTTVVFAGCNFPNCPRASIYGASGHDYRVLVVADAISGVRPHHLDELALLGVAHADTRAVTAALAG